MADLKISQFVDGGPAQTVDEIAANRSGVNTKIKVGTAASKNTGNAVGQVVLVQDVEGNAGLPALDGSQLSNVVFASESYLFDSSTVMANPGVGLIRFDNASLASVNNIAISHQTNANGNPDIGDWIATWADSTSTVKANLSIKKINGSFAQFFILGVTPQSGWTQVSVVPVDFNGGFTATDSTLINYSRTGDRGAAGAGAVASVVSGTGINVDSTNPAAPIVNLAAAPANTFKANNTAGSAVPVDITATQATAMLDVFDTSKKGLVPSPGASPTGARFLADDHTFKTIAGGLVQVVHELFPNLLQGTATIPDDDSPPLNSEGFQVMTKSITPQSSTNRLIIDSIVNTATTAQYNGTMALFMGAGSSSICAVNMNGINVANGRMSSALNMVVTAGTTAPLSFAVRVGCATSTNISFNGLATIRRLGGVSGSVITITEISV